MTFAPVEPEPTNLPLILAGPMVRRLQTDRLVLWLATSAPLYGRIVLHPGTDETVLDKLDLATCTRSIRVGRQAWLHLIEVPLNAADGDLIGYDLQLKAGSGTRPLSELVPDLLYPGQPWPTVAVHTRLRQFLHGSCRKPHYAGDDALAQVDRRIEGGLTEAEARPSLLMLTGDQIYADDVAGPMLRLIHDVIRRLGLYDERWQEAETNDSQGLFVSAFTYYHRESLLPSTRENRLLQDLFFGGVRKPIFTAVSARNHLITLSEMLAMYLLVWSPQLWPLLDRTAPRLEDRDKAEYERELGNLAGFERSLPAIHRALAHVPVYMIFDDHDITDDWNLTRGWEEAAYGHPFSRRIIGNALLAYGLCQGWGNDPERLKPLLTETIAPLFESASEDGELNEAVHDRTIDALLDWEEWHYRLPTDPKWLVLDTRTRRWRSESSPGKPSGLMDWEALTELQQDLIHERAVIMVSAAPVFGVKLIETVQRVFTFLGKALMVDAENWMAHPGAANVMLNIFQHARTPKHFTILSGDVHYSFVYDVGIKHSKSSPEITQITCSGLRNTFPEKLLPRFDRLDRWLFRPGSPLNWFTKRRRMTIRKRYPEGMGGRLLVNQCSLGYVALDDEGRSADVRLILSNGEEIRFGAPHE
ncbi:alkaline phosphatase family protein [Saccharospirillum salsuginis]|uniref:PhoD-like phosphatase n=1 Tax=Saccharospirillum salsuginis TaxID=418750 RepID=A0A918K1A0_9GAMM|nr:alkaline phosphatase family protein [Saccharospirillum salsuginis]GGX42869.1 hypothetical protein GCM10007392_06860 [Saccharospirillum salsuginis]